MKTIKLLVFGLMLTLAGSVQSQLSVNVHIGAPPAWGPAGYNDARYYYLPDVEAYYDVQSSMFIYMSGNNWIRRSYLPSRYRNYDLYHGYKVVMKDYRGNSPYSDFREHRMKYGKGYRGAEQHNVGERHERRDNDARQHNNNDVKNRNINPGNVISRTPDNGKDRGRNNENNNNDQKKDKKEGHDNGNRK